GAALRRVKVKVGREPARDPERLRIVREAVGDDVELLVDANGAFTPAEALRWAGRYADYGVAWFEEPVTSEDRAGLRRVRRPGPRRHGDRGRGVRVGPPGPARAGRLRGRPAGRRHPLRRHHQPPPGGRDLQSPGPALLGPLRARHLRPRLRGAGVRAAHR